MDAREAALRQAYDHAVRWLASLPDRRIPARASVDEIVSALGAELPAGPSTPADVVDLLATACEPGLTAFPSGRFYGFVVGGTEPAALAQRRLPLFGHDLGPGPRVVGGHGPEQAGRYRQRNGQPVRTAAVEVVPGGVPQAEPVQRALPHGPAEHGRGSHDRLGEPPVLGLDVQGPLPLLGMPACRHAKEHTPAQVVVHTRDGHIRAAYDYGDAPRGIPR